MDRGKQVYYIAGKGLHRDVYVIGKGWTPTKCDEHGNKLTGSYVNGLGWS